MNTFKFRVIALCIAAGIYPSLSRAQTVVAGIVTSTGNISITADNDATSAGIEAVSIGASGVTTIQTDSSKTQIFTPLTVTGASTLQGNNSLGGAGATNTLTGTNTVTGVTNINTGSSVSNTTIGNASNQTFLNSAVNNIGTNAGYASTNTIGNANAGTTVSSNAGASYNTLTNSNATMGTGTGGMVQTDASSASIRASSTGALASNGTTGVMSVNAGGGYTAYGTSQNTGTATIGGVVNNKQYTNKISGNTFVDGNLYINGTLDYVSSNSANTTVIGSSTGSSILPNATQSISAGTAIVVKGSTGTQTVVDKNGKLMNVTGTADQSTASLTLTNGVGNTHGLVVTETQATLSGGTHSSSLTMADNGATFSDAQTGGPVQVHGVNDGTGDFDAVNVRQFSGAIASVTAMANIPQVDRDGTYAIGVGVGSFMGKSALAAGMSYRFTRNGVFKASMSSAFTRADTDTLGLGVAWSY